MRSVKDKQCSGEGRSVARWAPAFAGALLSLCAPATAAEPTIYQRALAAGYKAAFLCSGIWNAGRTREQIEALELTGIYPDYQPLIAALPTNIPPERNRVEVQFDTSLPPRIARAEWGKGCVTLPIGTRLPDTEVSHGTSPVRPPLSKAAWPLGDGNIRPRPGTTLAGRVSAAFGPAYGERARSTGVVIVHEGRVVAERYAEGIDAATSNRTWSAAKSITGTLIGAAVQQGLLRTDAPAPIPEWRIAKDDPRAAITLDQLLRMASGLHSDTAGNRTDALYTGATTVTQEATHWPLEAQPGTRFRYANNDTLLSVRALRAALNDDARYLAFPRTALFEKIGMHHTVAETDWQDNFILSSQVWSTARDLARLGLLWLNDGVWNGERILPEGWVKYMTKPSGPQPAEGPGYGATLWLFGPQQGLPAGSYAAQGNRGQYVMVIPARRLVIVRRGEDPAGGGGFDIAKFTADVIAAIE